MSLTFLSIPLGSISFAFAYSTWIIYATGTIKWCYTISRVPLRALFNKILAICLHKKVDTCFVITRDSCAHCGHDFHFSFHFSLSFIEITCVKYWYSHYYSWSKVWGRGHYFSVKSWHYMTFQPWLLKWSMTCSSFFSNSDKIFWGTMTRHCEVLQ